MVDILKALVYDSDRGFRDPATLSKEECEKLHDIVAGYFHVLKRIQSSMDSAPVSELSELADQALNQYVNAPALKPSITTRMQQWMAHDYMNALIRIRDAANMDEEQARSVIQRKISNVFSGIDMR